MAVTWRFLGVKISAEGGKWRRIGTNAAVSVTFDSPEIGRTMDEMIAFGTAVVI